MLQLPQYFTLYAIYSLGQYDEEPFDTGRLPLEIANCVRIEHVAPLLREDTFDHVKSRMGTSPVEQLAGVEYALVHRYEIPATDAHAAEKRDPREASEELVRNIAACLRLIRPMRQSALSMHGTVREDGTFDVVGFDHPIGLLETPENQKLFHLRNQDADDLLKYAPLFLQAMNGGIWKFKMAAQFHELGHFQQFDWKARYLLWASAIESIYTSHNSEHKGTNVAKERIKWFLGETTSVYPPGDISEFLVDPHITVGSIVVPLYEVRNFLAHGDRIPDKYFTDKARGGLNGPLHVVAALSEAESFIIRQSLLKILRDGLTAHFAGAAENEAYFGGQGLTNSELQKKKKAGSP